MKDQNVQIIVVDYNYINEIFDNMKNQSSRYKLLQLQSTVIERLYLKFFNKCR